jgi:hypothetical protein
MPAEGQPPITPDSGLVSTDWLPGPLSGTTAPVIVSFTDFGAHSREDSEAIIQTGLGLAESWPIMHGAVGLWLWAKPGELRGGSLSVWSLRDELRNFIRWPVHVAIMKEWRGRIEVHAETWEDQRFGAIEAWSRAEKLMRAPRELAVDATAQASS